MRITIRGGTKEQKLHARRFCEFFAKKYFKDKLAETLSVKLVHKPYKEDENLAECVWEDEACPPKQFLIEFCVPETTDIVQYLRTLAHELVHVKQYALGELRQLPSTNNEICVWHGKRYEWEMDYWERPWEIEALGREKGIVLKYSELYNLPHEEVHMF